MSTRRNKSTLPDPKDQRIAELEAQLAQAQAVNQKLQKQLERLQAEVGELRRAGKRHLGQFRELASYATYRFDISGGERGGDKE